MRKIIIFGAIAALIGLAATAQAGNDHPERGMRSGDQFTYTDTDERHEAAEHNVRERAEHSDRGGDAKEHGRERKERSERQDRD